MSTTVDQRVVEMRFDNKHFESNVSTTMSTLDKLKSKLHLTGASKGLEEINASAKRVDMSGLGRSIETVSAKFSALQVMGVTALANITNSAVNAGKRMVAAFTVDPVKTGFQEYELKMGSVQTIMASTGEKLETVNKYLEELNTYSDKTIYSFSDMTNNIGKFTNAGVKLEDAVLAIKGISNEAAVSGANANEASRAMYNFSQALSTGYVKLIDWKSIENANMATVEFKNQLIASAVACGTLKDNLDGTYTTLEKGTIVSATRNFNDSLQEQWMTTEVLTKTLANYATDVREMSAAEKEAYEEKLRGQGYTEEQIKSIEELGQKAFDSAQDIKTFSMMMDTLKEAAQSGWAKTWELLLGDFEQAKTLWTALGGALGSFIDKMSKARNDVLESALGRGFADLAKRVREALDPIKKSAQSIKAVTDSVKDYAKVVDEIISGKWGNGQPRWDKLTEAGYDWAHAQNLVNEKLGNSKRHITDYVEAQDKLKESQNGVTESQNETADSTVSLTEKEKARLKMLLKLSEADLKLIGHSDEQIAALNELRATADKLGMSTDDLIDNINEIDGRWLLIDSFKNAGKGLVTVLQSIGYAWRLAFHGDATDEEILNKRSEAIFNMIAALHKFSTYLLVDDDTAEKLTRTFRGLFAILDLITTIAGGGFKITFKVLTNILSYFNLDILSVTANVGDAIVAFRDWFESIFDVSGALDAIIPTLIAGIKYLKDWFDTVKQMPSVRAFIDILKSIGKSFMSIGKYKPGTEEFNNFFVELGKKIGTALKTLPEIAIDIGKNIVAGLNIGLGDGVKNVLNTIISIAEHLIEGICNALGIHSPSTVFIAIGGFIIAGLLLGLKEGFVSVPESLQGIVDKCLEVLKNIDWGTVFAIGVSLTALAFIKKVGDALEAFSAPFAGVGAILDNTADVVKSFGKVTKSMAMEIKTKALKNLAVSLAILVGCVAAIVYIAGDDYTKILKAVGIITLLAGVLVGLAFASNLMSEASVKIDKNGASLDGLRNGLLTMAISIGLLALTVKLIGSMKPGEAKQGFIGLAGVLVAMLGFMAIAQLITKKGVAENVTKLASLITRLSIAMLLMVGVCKLAGKLSGEEILKGAGFAVAFMTFTGIISLIAKEVDSKELNKLGLMMVEMAIALGLMVGVCKLVSILDADEAMAGIVFAIAFTAFVKLLVNATKISNDKQIAKLGGLLLSISFSMLLMVGICKLVGKLSEDELIKGAAFVVGFTIFVGLLVRITKVSSEQQIARVAGTILALSVAIGVLAGVSIMMSLINTEGLIKGVTAVSVLSLIMATMIAACKGVNDIKGNLIVMTVAIAVMAAAVAGLSFIEPEKLAGATAAMTMLIGVFALLVKAGNYGSSAGKSVATIAILAAAVGMLAGVLWLMSTLEVKSSLENAEALSVLLLAMAGSMVILSKMTPNVGNAIKSIALLALLTAPLILFAIALKKMNGVENAITNAIVLSGLMLAMTVILGLLSGMGSLASNALMGIGTLTLMVLPMLAFVGALALMNNLNNATQNAITLTGLMTAMTILLVPLSIIGALVGVSGGIILLGIVALAAMAVPMLEFVGILALMNCIQNATTNAKLLVFLMTTMTDLLIKLSIVGPLALLGVAAMAGLSKLLVEIGVMTVAVGALVKNFPELEDFIDRGIPILEKLAHGIGSIIGNFASGMLEGVTSGLPIVGQNLTDFMDKASGFIEGAKNVDEKFVKGVGYLSAAIIALTIAEFIDGISKFSGIGQSSLPKLGTDLSEFMDKASGFIEGISVVDQDTIESSKKLVEMLLMLTATDLLSKITAFLSGGTNFTTMGNSLEEYGEAVCKFSNIISQNGGIDSEAVEAASKAGMLMVELEKSLPRSGGFLQAVIGEKDLTNFSNSCEAFGKCIVSFSKTIVNNGGVNSEAVESAVKAGELMSALQDSLPRTGGAWQLIAGEKDITNFGKSCAAFGESITEFSNAIVDNGGVNSKAVESAVKAGELMSALQDSLPRTGGAWQYVAGEKDITTFGLCCVAFGNAMSQFPAVDISDETIESVRQAGELMTELQNSLPKTGGAWQYVAGEKDLSAFAASCLEFSNAMKNLSGMPVISDEVLNSVKKAGTMMTELQNSIASSGGWKQEVTGEKDLSTFTSSCLSFSNAMANLASMPGISEDAIASVKNAGGMLVELQKSIPESAWLDGKMNLAEFSKTVNAFRDSLNNLASLTISEEVIQSVRNAGNMLVNLQKTIPDSTWLDGKMNLSEFSNTVNEFTSSLKAFSENGINEEAVNAANRTGMMMIALQKAIPESKWFDGKVDLSDFGKKIKSFGGYLVDYSDKISEIDQSVVSASILNAGRLATLANKLVGLDTSGIDNFKVKAIGSEMKAYANKVEDIDTGVVTSSITSANRLIRLINSLVGLDTSGISSFQIKTIGEKLKGYSNAVVDVDYGAIIASISSAIRLRNLINSLASLDTSGVGSFKAAIENLGSIQVGNITTIFDKASVQLVNVGVKMINSITNGMKSRQSYLIGSTTSLVNLMVNKLQNSIPVFNTVGTNLIVKLASGMSSQKGKVTSSIASSLSSAISSIRGEYMSFYYAGSYVVDGFAAGISANTFKAEATAIAMAEAALEAAKEALLEHSPSRAFYKVGDYAGQGFVNALSDYESISYNSSYDMADYARKGLSDAIGKINDAFHNDIDPQPTIRPVLDLTNVESGASYISGLFSNGASIGVTTRVGSINSMMNRNNQNGANREVVSAIEGLRKDLGKVGGTTYNVNGITYDDGSTVSRAIQDIVRAANIERRA